MKLFFHHVGLAGANEDFKKTVFNKVPLSVVEDSVGEGVRSEILDRLLSAFPRREFNCWGVPEGARTVIQNLEVGDTVLLVKTTAGEGSVPAMCGVKAFWRVQLRGLSEALWGDDKYPYIFFFDTEALELTWQDLAAHLGYSGTFNPRGQFYSVADFRLTIFAGAEGYVKYLRGDYRMIDSPVERVTPAQITAEVGEAPPTYVRKVERELSSLIDESCEGNPTLLGNVERKSVRTVVRPRNAAFRIAIKKLYGYRCAICGISLHDPHGQSAVESAHIYPKYLDGSDDFRNGVCLCPMHHWAFDAGWLSIGDDYAVLIHQDLPPTQDYSFIRDYAGQQIRLPVREEFKPHPLFLREHRRLKGFEPPRVMTDEELDEFVSKNPTLRVERNAQGEVIIMSPTGGDTSRRNAKITSQLNVWAERDGTGVSFDSSGGFRLPNKAVRSPDASWVERSRWESLTTRQRKRYVPLCPDFVIELRSESDPLQPLLAKMQEYIAQGAKLAWLIDPKQKCVYVYDKKIAGKRLDKPRTLSGGSVLPGFKLDLDGIF
ncbi:MAG TPA: Uma2 family endonuclease [Pyrinomonadaceae bacterium]|jgi:Uma2 family endonuclease|nr:Uma2 family endonuclease [Pyrinomonadaceae bacterium]